MSTTTSTSDRDDTGHDDADVAAGACHLYDAECALHAAHQSGVEQWIAAAAEKLHAAVVEYLAAIAAQTNAHQP
jgi:hypothetical protein